MTALVPKCEAFNCGAPRERGLYCAAHAYSHYGQTPQEVRSTVERDAVGSVVEQEFGELLDAYADIAYKNGKASTVPVAGSCKPIAAARAALTAKYEQVVRENANLHIEAKHLYGELASLREDALTVFEACAALGGLPPEQEIRPKEIPSYRALRDKLKRIASRTSTDTENTK